MTWRGPATAPPASQDEANPLPCCCAALHPERAQPSHPGPRASPAGAGRGRAQASSSSFHILFPPCQTRTKNKQAKENAAASFLAVDPPERGLLAPREEVWLKRPSLEQLIPRLTKQEKNMRTKPGAANRIKSDGVLPLTLVSQEDKGGAGEVSAGRPHCPPLGTTETPPRREQAGLPWVSGDHSLIRHTASFILSIQHRFLLF